MEVQSKLEPEINIAPVTAEPMPDNPGKSSAGRQLVAWSVMLAAFGLFCLVAWLLFNFVTDLFSQSVELKTVMVGPLQERQGVVFVQERGQPREVVLQTPDQVKELAEIRTDRTGSAFVRFFDGTRLNLAPATRISLDSSRVETNRFSRSEKRLTFTLLEGQVTVIPAPFAAGKEYSKATIKALLPQGDNRPPAQVLLNDSLTGNYAEGQFNLSQSRLPEGTIRTWVSNKGRKAVDVKGNSRTISLTPGSRVVVEQGEPGEPGLPGERQEDFIINGSFINGIDSWTPSRDQGSDKGKIDGIIQFDAERIDDGIQPRVRLWRLDPLANGNFAETSLVQEINRDVTEYEELWFSIKVNLKAQSLAGGGQQGFEYPLFVKIYYLDNQGNQQEFFYGFYYKAADNRTQVLDAVGLSRKLVQAEWEEYRRNLLDLKSKPTRILKIIVGSAGHLYDSYVTDVSLVAR